MPPGEQLYTGIKKIEITDKPLSKSSNEVLNEIEAALSYPPNNSLLGSSSIRVPFPFGLWVYNAFIDKPGKLNQWIFKNFSATPILISTVKPEIRTRIANNLLREYGYFNGEASYQIITNKRDTLKAKILYELTLNEPYTIDSIEYRSIQHQVDTFIGNSERLLKVGDNFSVVNLEAERQRISSLMREKGYYYFRPEYIIYQADSTLNPNKVSLRVDLKPGLPSGVMHPWRIGDVKVNLRNDINRDLTDSTKYEDLKIYYKDKLRVKPKVLYKQIRVRPEELYSPSKQLQTQSNLSQLGVFRFTEMQYIPRDTTPTNDILDVKINTIYDLDLNGEMEINFTANNNKRIGPGLAFSLIKNNAFGGGESLGVNLNGNYEWLIGRNGEGHNDLTDNYEYGITGTLNLPRILLPNFFKREYEFPATTTLQLYANRLNRAEFFRLLSFGGNATYDFLPDPIRHHAFIPFRLTFNRLERTTERFDILTEKNPTLYESLQDQFVPAVSYTYTLDNSLVREGRHMTWWQLSVTESGNLLSGAYALAGKKFDETKEMLGNPFAQFLKLTTELRYNYALDRKNRIVARLAGGIIYSYGNSRTPPYNEQFYVGGANSIRAFTIRTVGPGRYIPVNTKNQYDNLDHVGDLKFEGNLEHRFRILGDMEGAYFLDVGNIWLLREDEEMNRVGGVFDLKHLLNDLAVGTGFGIRYTFAVIVVRLDIGLGLHLPYDTGKRGYFNAYDKLGFHIAIGYPF